MSDPPSPVALDAYEALADEYAARAPEKPFNADLDRPATQSLCPDLDGLDVLDAGCGPGITTEHLVSEGANVVGVDLSPRMLRHARERVGRDTDFVRLDFGRELPFADGSFDLIYSSLAITYVKDWDALFREFERVLRPSGTLVFSTQHPFDDAQRLKPDNYFEVEEVTETWDGFGDPVDVTFYRRPIEQVVNPLLESGFTLERMLEAKPTEQFRQKAPETYERIFGTTTFLCIRARTGE